MTILFLLLAIWPFHHRQEKPAPGPTADQVSFGIDLVDTIAGDLPAYETADLACYEQPQITLVKHDIDVAQGETDPKVFMHDVNILQEEMNALAAWDAQLQRENLV